MRIQSLKVDAELEKLLVAARQHVMTEEEYREQRISFAYGNLAIDNPEITKEMVREAADHLRPIR
jgi:hypothetical protein